MKAIRACFYNTIPGNVPYFTRTKCNSRTAPVILAPYVSHHGQYRGLRTGGNFGPQKHETVSTLWSLGSLVPPTRSKGLNYRVRRLHLVCHTQTVVLGSTMHQRTRCDQWINLLPQPSPARHDSSDVTTGQGQASRRCPSSSRSEASGGDAPLGNALPKARLQGHHWI